MTSTAAPKEELNADLLAFLKAWGRARYLGPPHRHRRGGPYRVV